MFYKGKIIPEEHIRKLRDYDQSGIVEIAPIILGRVRSCFNIPLGVLRPYSLSEVNVFPRENLIDPKKIYFRTFTLLKESEARFIHESTDTYLELGETIAFRSDTSYEIQNGEMQLFSFCIIKKDVQ